MLGLIHEQKRSDAPIHWNPEKVYQYYAFTGWSNEQIFEQVMRPDLSPAVDMSPFDTNSIMIYPIPPGLANVVVGWTTDLSPMDKAFIGRVYPFKAVSPPEKVLKVGDAPVAGEIATDGQVAGYRFTAPKGRYVIEVNGATPVLVGLFGPSVVPTPSGSAAAEGLNVRLEAELDPADFPAAAGDQPVYRVQVRHKTPRAGTGPFSIRVAVNPSN